jgi:S-DNA-T family DNA segregation ATPase FtsK/SpoIIIE
LGTSAYKSGIRATTFRPEVDAGLGYLVGASAQAQVTRTYYLDMAATEKIAARARAIRERAGTLSGVALGDESGPAERDVLADVLAVLAGTSGLHWQQLADRLADRYPDRWADTSGEAVRAECATRGVPSKVVAVDGQRARGCRTADAEAAVSPS